MNKLIPIEGERIILRSYKRADASSVSAVASHPEVYATTYNMPLNFTPSYAKAWFERLEIDRRNGRGVEPGIFDKQSGAYIGHCGINSIVPSCKSGNLVYFIDPKLWGRGYATEAARLMLNYGFDALGLARISGICMEHNASSRRVLEKIGMSYEGCGVQEIIKDQVPINVLHFAILRVRGRTGHFAT